jgi:homoprotocatechuate degradation regulator HpaR
MTLVTSTDAKPPPIHDLPADTDRSLAIALTRARESVVSRFRPLLAENGMSEQQWRVLRVLEEESPLDASCVAARACILAPSLTRMIRSLEDRHFVKRMRDADDGRRSLLSITAGGRAFIASLAPAALAINADLRSRYGAQRWEDLIDMLNDLAGLDAGPAYPGRNLR